MCTANTLSAMSSALGKCFASYVVVWKTLGFCLFVPKGKTFFFSFPTFSAYCKLTKAQAAAGSGVRREKQPPSTPPQISWKLDEICNENPGNPKEISDLRKRSKKTRRCEEKTIESNCQYSKILLLLY